jgi:hypothetical protein
MPIKNEERIISGEMNIKKMDQDFVEIVKIHPQTDRRKNHQEITSEVY